MECVWGWVCVWVGGCVTNLPWAKFSEAMLMQPNCSPQNDTQGASASVPVTAVPVIVHRCSWHRHAQVFSWGTGHSPPGVILFQEIKRSLWDRKKDWKKKHIGHSLLSSNGVTIHPMFPVFLVDRALIPEAEFFIPQSFLSTLASETPEKSRQNKAITIHWPHPWWKFGCRTT